MFADLILGISLTINSLPYTFLNVYFPDAATLFTFLPSFTPPQNFYMTGDYNCHHTSWYGPAAQDYPDLIRNAATRSPAGAQWTEKHQLVLANRPGVFTHLPRNGNRPSIIDLTWSRSNATPIVTSWHAPPDGGHESDHTSTYSMITIALPVFTPRRMYSKCDWKSFADTVKYAKHPGPPGSAADCLI